MNPFHSINSIPHKIAMGILPDEGDIIIVSIDAHGNPGELNQYVLNYLGYSKKDLPSYKLLSSGYYLLDDKKRKPILFIVTVGQGNTQKTLEENLFKALVINSIELIDRSVWIPLMGTGAGGLTLEDSLNIIVKVTHEFWNQQPTKTMFLFSIPENKSGERLISYLKEINDSSRAPEEELEKFKGNFYLAGSFWSGDEQSNRFFNNGVWENGHDEKFLNVVRSTQVGDIVFLKSTYSKRGKSYLRIKGVGRVIENPKNGIELFVDWKIRDIEINIEQLGKYRRTYARVMPNDLAFILDKVGKRRIVEAGLLDPSEGLPKDKLTSADLIADGVEGEDYLDIGKDVLAFSRVMAASTFQPPLAIALFGKWGSGKSFFMNKLQNKIEELSRTGIDSPYCQGIAQIHFNAWSYLDANLWAGIVTRIFDGLSEYISNDNKAKDVKKEIEIELSQQLNVTKEEIALLEKRKQAVEDQISMFQKKKNVLTEKLRVDINTIKERSLHKIISNVDEQFKIDEKITKALESNDTYIKSREQLKKIVPEKYWKNPQYLYSQVRSKYTFLREFCRRDRIKSNLIWFCVIIVAIFVLPILLVNFTDILKGFNFLIPQAGLSILVTVGAIWKRAETTYEELRPIIASFWDIKIDYEKRVEEALYKIDQEEKALKYEIEQSKEELELVNDQIDQANFTKNDLDFRINNALATEALYSFIEKRSESEDYQKYLGIVSLIRKDFEILSSLFLEHKEEDFDNEQFRDKFERPLERIILYIDDLDRCPEDRVVEVLEAVNLLMAFPLFIVVVGVDPRWVKNALLKKYELQFTGEMNGYSSSKSLNAIESIDYLEKIFQVPFHLKEASDDSVKDMLKTLIQSRIDPLEEKEINNTEEISNGKSEIIEDANIPYGGDTQTTTVISTNKLNHLPKSLTLSKKEIELMQDLSPIIGNNPRAIKRFVNVYQIVRAHEELTYNIAEKESEFLIIMFLLALPVGPFSKLTPAFKNYITNQDNQLKPLSFFLGTNYKVDGLDKLKHDLYVEMSDKKSFQVLQGQLIGTFYKHNHFIQRFTFDDCK